MMIRYSFLYLILVFSFWGCSKNGQSTNDMNSTGNQTGIGGSLARYTIVDKYLYTVDGQSLRVFDLDAANGPQFMGMQNIGFNIETIFPFKNYLFIGSNNAMYIYALTNPAQPQLLSQTFHINGCDPVVANDSMAYLTIHGGNACGSMINELQVYNIQQIQSPQWVRSIAMTNPLGLGIYDRYLYVCDRGKGLYVMDIQEANNPTVLNRIEGEVFLDVIPDPTTKTLIVMLQDGIALYDLNNPVQLPLLAVIK